MSIYTENEILSSIDNIDSCVQEALLDVFECTIKEYDKLSQLGEFSIFEEAYVMEGKIWDEATGKNTLDGFIKKVILFIPRLLRGIVRAIASVFTDKFSEETKINGEKAVANLNSTNDPNKLALAKENISEMSEGELELDVKTKKFKLGNGLKHIKNYLRILTGVGPILSKIRMGIDGGKTSYGVAAKELWNVIRGKASAEELKDISADALFELAQDSNRVARGLQGIADELSMKLEKDMAKAQQEGGDMSKYAEMKDLVDALSNISKNVKHVSFLGRIALRLGKDMGGGSIFLRKLRNATAYDKEEDVAMMNAETEGKKLKSQIMANKRTTAKLEDDTKRIAKKQKKIEKLQRKNEKLQNKLDEVANDAKVAAEVKADQKRYSNYADSAEIEVDDNEIIDEGTFKEEIRAWTSGEDGGTEIIDGKEYSKTKLGSMRGGPPTKWEEDLEKKFHGSVLCRPIGDKKALEYWKRHNQDDDYSILLKPDYKKDEAEQAEQAERTAKIQKIKDAKETQEGVEIDG